MKKPKQPEPTKFQAIGELLKNYGNSVIDEERFWREMIRAGYNQDDIDWWCQEHYAESVQ